MGLWSCLSIPKIVRFTSMFQFPWVGMFAVPRAADFYRAMLCIARTILSPDVCPSVARRYCVKTAKRYHQTFFTFAWPHRSSFSTPNVMAILRRRPPNGASNVGGVWKTRDFRPISRFSSETIQDMAIVRWEYLTVPSVRMVQFSMTLNDT